MNLTDCIRKIESMVQQRLTANEDGHDWDHTVRVRKNALEIGRKEGADLLVLEAAALLHDIGRPEESACHGRVDHALIGAELGKELLQKAGVESVDLQMRIAACIRTHRYRRRPGTPFPESLEEKILFDADKLDALGAIGLGRAFHFAGHVGARVHNTQEEALSHESYSREDTAYREYLVKLRHLPATLFTATGWQMARRRLEFMDRFFEELNRETEG